REYPAYQIAQIIRQIGVIARSETLASKVCVLSEDALPQYEIAESVHADLLLHLQRRNHVAEALGHLLTFDSPKAMHVQMFVQRQARRHQHGGPKHPVGFNNVLADEMFRLRPEPFQKILAFIL